MRLNMNITAMRRVIPLLLFLFLCFNNVVAGEAEHQPNELVGEVMKRAEDAFAQHEKDKKALKALVSKPLTDTQQELLRQLLPHTGTLDETLSSASYLTYLKAEVGKEYKDFPAYVAAMPTAKQKTDVLFSFKKALPPKTKAEVLSVCTNYYFKLRVLLVKEPNTLDDLNALIAFQTKNLMEPLMAIYPAAELFSHMSEITQLATVTNLRGQMHTEVFTMYGVSG